MSRMQGELHLTKNRLERWEGTDQLTEKSFANVQSIADRHSRCVRSKSCLRNPRNQQNMPGDDTNFYPSRTLPTPCTSFSVGSPVTAVRQVDLTTARQRGVTAVRLGARVTSITASYLPARGGRYNADASRGI